MRKFRIFLFTIFCIVIFISCEKNDSDGKAVVYYYGSNISDIEKIKELISDADCDKGIIYKYVMSSSHQYFNTSGTTTEYCDDWQGTISGTIYLVEYNRSKKTVVIEGDITGVRYYGGKPYTVYIDYTYSFYTKNNH